MMIVAQNIAFQCLSKFIKYLYAHIIQNNTKKVECKYCDMIRIQGMIDN